MPLTQVQPGMLGTPQPYNFKNRIINGAMVISQRGTSFPGQTGGLYYSDRWQAFQNYGTVTVANTTTAPTGFTNSTSVTVTTPNASPGSTAVYALDQSIEGFNVADCGFGTANAKTMTVSFWVRASIAGIYCVFFRNSGGSRYYTAEYTISSANTWEQKSVTFAGDTSGTWLTDNGVGIDVGFTLGAGSGRFGTANTWSSNAFCTSNQTNLIGTNGATFFLTGVQLEVGVTATSFDYRPYGTELFLCQRYYYQVTAGADSFTQFGFGRAFSTTAGNGIVQFPVPMRTKPNFAFLGVVGNYDFSPTGISGGAVPASNTHMTVGMTFSSITNGSIFVLGQSSSSTPCGFTFSAEL
jgi:hypothetical protein